VIANVNTNNHDVWRSNTSKQVTVTSGGHIGPSKQAAKSSGRHHNRNNQSRHLAASHLKTNNSDTPRTLSFKKDKKMFP